MNLLQKPPATLFTLKVHQKMRSSVCVVAAFSLLQPLVCGAQEFRPRGQAGQRPSSAPATGSVQSQPRFNTPGTGWNRGAMESSEPISSNLPRGASSVSSDLLQIYSQTKNVQSEADATSIARTCAKVVSDSSRSSIDQEYATSLLAWALNRRGEIRSQQAEALIRAGRRESASQLDAKAADDFATAVRYAPENWRHRHNYAISLAMKGDYPRAIEQLDKAIELNPQYANAWFNRAELHFESGNHAAAERDYTEAIHRADDAQYYNSRGHCRFLMQAYAAALEDYRKASELAQDNTQYATDLGDACQFLGLWEQAAVAYRSAVAIDPRCVRAYQNAAWLMASCPDEKIRNAELAEAAAKKALDLAGRRTAEIVETMAAAAAARGRWDDAIQRQREAIQLLNQQSAVSENQIAEFKQRLRLYEGYRPYIQPQPPADRSSETIARRPDSEEK